MDLEKTIFLTKNNGTKDVYKTTGFTCTLFRQPIKQANDDIKIRVDLELCSTCMLSWLIHNEFSTGFFGHWNFSLL